MTSEIILIVYVLGFLIYLGMLFIYTFQCEVKLPIYKKVAATGVLAVILLFWPILLLIEIGTYIFHRAYYESLMKKSEEEND